MNFKLHYTSDEEAPLKAEVDIPISSNQRQIIEEEKGMFEGEREEGKQQIMQSEDMLNIYDEGIFFIDPMIMISMKSNQCMTYKVNNKRLVKYTTDKCRGCLSLLNRSKNKPIFLRNLKEMLLKENLNL